MTSFRPILGLSAAALLLAGCSLDDIWPSLSGDEPSGQPLIIATPDEGPSSETIFNEPANDLPPLSVESKSSISDSDRQIPGAPSTGTYVGSKVEQFRDELNDMHMSVVTRKEQYLAVRNTARQNAQSYYATAAAITARLQVGSTPGNPILSSQWNAAQSELDRLLTDVAALNALGNQVAADSAMAAYLLDAVRATYSLQGAVDEDHKRLALIEDKTNSTLVIINRLLSGLRETTDRFTHYVNAERKNLTTLALAIKNGEYLGPSLSNQTGYIPPAKVASMTNPGNAEKIISERRPLIVIRFDRNNVEFKQALYSTISAVLERRPQSSFDVISISPNSGPPADIALASNTIKGHAQTVLRALAEMGLPSSRLVLSSSTSSAVQTGEVRIYAR
tara:strand:+ start:510 stop:1685 length:1176 start_codon:yes stop_codon:yes gene_type:complete